MRHSQAEARTGAKFEDSKHGEANSGNGRTAGVQDSTHVHVLLDAGDEWWLEVCLIALYLWHRAIAPYGFMARAFAQLFSHCVPLVSPAMVAVANSMPARARLEDNIFDDA